MIESVHVQGFQSHKDTLIELHPGVNAITGSSDSGKSAFLRALTWAIINEPRGEGFRSWWDDVSKTSVTIKFDTQVCLTRTRSNTLNQYQIDKQEPLKALRVGVPDEVQAVLRMSELNIQRQHKPYFLLQDKGSVVASQFNHIAKLQIMESCTKEAKTLTRTLKKESETTSVEIDNTNDALDALNWLPEADAAIRELELLEDEILTLEHKIEQTQQLCSDYENAVEDMEELYKVIDLYEDVQEVLSLSDTIDSTQQHIDKTNELLNTHEQLSIKLQACASLETLNSEVAEVLLLSGKINTTATTINDTTALINEYESTIGLLHSAQNATTELEQTFKDQFAEYDTCPLCDAPTEK